VGHLIVNYLSNRQ